MTPTVRILINHEKMEFAEVPVSEIPKGYVKVHFQDLGEAYADLSKFKASDHRHPEFPEEVRLVLRRQMETFGDALCFKTFEEWEDGFRRDAHPWREIALWDVIRRAFERFAGHIVGIDEASLEKRKDVLLVITQLTNAGDPPKGGKFKYPAVGTVTSKRVEEIAKWLPLNGPDIELIRRLRLLIKPDRNHGPDRLPLDALFGEDLSMNRDAPFDPRDLVDEADVILGVDVDSGHERLFFGRDSLASIIAGGVEQPAKVLRVEIDQGTDDLEKLAALVQVIKGKHDVQ